MSQLFRICPRCDTALLADTVDCGCGHVYPQGFSAPMLNMVRFVHQPSERAGRTQSFTRPGTPHSQANAYSHPAPPAAATVVRVAQGPYSPIRMLLAVTASVCAIMLCNALFFMAVGTFVVRQDARVSAPVNDSESRASAQSDITGTDSNDGLGVARVSCRGRQLPNAPGFNLQVPNKDDPCVSVGFIDSEGAPAYNRLRSRRALGFGGGMSGNSEGAEADRVSGGRVIAGGGY